MKMNNSMSVLLAGFIIAGSMVAPSFATDLEDYEEPTAISKEIDGQYKIGDILSFEGKELHKYTLKVDKTTKLNADMTIDYNPKTKSHYESDFDIYNSKGERMTNGGRCLTLDKTKNVYIADTVQVTLPADTYTIYYYSNHSKLTISYVKTKLTVYDIYGGEDCVTGKTEPNATVKLYIDGKKIRTEKADSKGNFSIYKGDTAYNKKAKVVASKSGYKEASVTKIIKASVFYKDSFKINRVYSTDTKITGTFDDIYFSTTPTKPYMNVYVYKGSKKLGKMSFKGSYWDNYTMSCTIPKQKVGTKLTIKVVSNGYKTLTMTTTVRNKYYTCKYGKKHYDTHTCGCKYMTSSVRKKLSYYEVYNVKKVKDSCGDYDVQGVFVNNTKRKYRYVEIMVKFYDKNGHVLCTNFTNTLNVSPGEKWNWKVIGCNNSKTSYIKIVQITMNR